MHGSKGMHACHMVLTAAPSPCSPARIQTQAEGQRPQGNDTSVRQHSRTCRLAVDTSGRRDSLSNARQMRPSRCTRRNAPTGLH